MDSLLRGMAPRFDLTLSSDNLGVQRRTSLVGE
jgi:hypothetical protein